jgi:hypothetical protein
MRLPPLGLKTALICGWTSLLTPFAGDSFSCFQRALDLFLGMGKRESTIPMEDVIALQEHSQFENTVPELLITFLRIEDVLW